MAQPFLLLALLLSSSSGGPQTLPAVPVYEAKRALRAPVIDGELGEEEWWGAQWTEEFMDIRGPEWPPPAYRTRVKILWDEDYLYLGAELEEPHLWGTLSRRDAVVYQDDDLEVFLDPDGNGRDYYEVEINVLGTVFDLYLDRPYREGGRADIQWDLQGLLTGISLQGTLNDPSDRDQGWTVEMGVPWAHLTPPPKAPAGVDGAPQPTRRGQSTAPGPTAPLPPQPGVEWRVNFSRVDWPLVILRSPTTGDGVYRKDARTEAGLPHPEANWVWSPQGVIDMHIPGRWGVVRFVEAPPPGGSS